MSNFEPAQTVYLPIIRKTISWVSILYTPWVFLLAGCGGSQPNTTTRQSQGQVASQDCGSQLSGIEKTAASHQSCILDSDCEYVYGDRDCSVYIVNAGSVATLNTQIKSYISNCDNSGAMYLCGRTVMPALSCQNQVCTQKTTTDSCIRQAEALYQLASADSFCNSNSDCASVMDPGSACGYIAMNQAVLSREMSMLNAYEEVCLSNRISSCDLTKQPPQCIGSVCK